MFEQICVLPRDQRSDRRAGRARDFSPHIRFPLRQRLANQIKRRNKMRAKMSRIRLESLGPRLPLDVTRFRFGGDMSLEC
jgi:hypothetical protein